MEPEILDALKDAHSQYALKDEMQCSFQQYITWMYVDTANLWDAHYIDWQFQ